MKWRYAAIAVVLLSLVTVRLAVGVPRVQATSVTYSGQVDIALGTDGKLLVLVDEASADQPSDGLVDQAFRLQGAPSLAYSGAATVTYTRGRVTVQVGDAAGWVFDVAGRDLPPSDLLLASFTITGIGHAWGASIHKSPATLFTTLVGSCSAKTTTQSSVSSMSTATLLDGDPICKNCVTGGPGVSSCKLDCGDGSPCEADCDSDSYACCGCQGSCGCCSNTQIGGHH